MNKKTLALGTAASAFCVMALVGVASATTNTKPATLATDIAQKFNLKPADVQSVIDNHKTEARSYHETQQADRIAQAVKDGKITQAQADVLTAKIAELKPAVKHADGFKPTDAQRAAMKAKMESFRTWLKDNNIPTGLVGGLGHHGGHGGIQAMDGGKNHK